MNSYLLGWVRWYLVGQLPNWMIAADTRIFLSKNLPKIRWIVTMTTTTVDDRLYDICDKVVNNQILFDVVYSELVKMYNNGNVPPLPEVVEPDKISVRTGIRDRIAERRMEFAERLVRNGQINDKASAEKASEALEPKAIGEVIQVISLAATVIQFIQTLRTGSNNE